MKAEDYYKSDDEVETYDWLCTCGKWNEDWPFHCQCGREPPCGCECDECLQPEPDIDDIAIWNAMCDEGFEYL